MIHECWQIAHLDNQVPSCFSASWLVYVTFSNESIPLLYTAFHDLTLVPAEMALHHGFRAHRGQALVPSPQCIGALD